MVLCWTHENKIEKNNFFFFKYVQKIKIPTKEIQSWLPNSYLLIRHDIVKVSWTLWMEAELLYVKILWLQAKFSKLSNCKNHIKSHSRPIKQNPDSEETSESEIREYKCKMCSSKYFHASSLSKHIVKRHIQIHSNKHT